MSEHGKKMIAPIVVTVLTVIYFIVYFTLLIHMLTGLVRLLLGVVPLAFICVMIAVFSFATASKLGSSTQSDVSSAALSFPPR